MERRDWGYKRGRGWGVRRGGVTKGTTRRLYTPYKVGVLVTYTGRETGLIRRRSRGVQRKGVTDVQNKVFSGKSRRKGQVVSLVQLLVG